MTISRHNIFIIILSLGFLFLIGHTTQAQAQDTQNFTLPLDCTLNQDCWIANYLDVDKTDGAQDFNCGPRSYDTHKGTDFAITDRLAMEKEVNAVAAADGTIMRFRDGQDDWPPIMTEEIQEAQLALFDANKGCGNGVFIDHGNGWKGIYCHLKKGSINVKKGQKVKAGDKIGLVGQSGFAQFPHIHLGLYHNDKIIDPFSGKTADEGCSKPDDINPLWDQSLHIEYDPVVFYAAGFKNGAPDFDSIKIDATSAHSYPADIKALTFWFALYGINDGDMIDVEIRDPYGLVFARQEIVQQGNKIRQFYFTGKKINKPLKTGEYHATATLTRMQGGIAPIRRKISRTLRIEDASQSENTHQ